MQVKANLLLRQWRSATGRDVVGTIELGAIGGVGSV